MHDEGNLSRRRILIRATGLVAGAVALAASRAVVAKAAKADFYYQDTPKNGQSCSGCRMFQALPEGRGRCALVEGEVSATGWCMAYSAKSS